MPVINGGPGGDTLGGFGPNDTINGFGANDSLSGGGGNDQIFGGAGFDTINGGAGNDTILGGSGNDRMSGGVGSDVLSTVFFNGNYVLNLVTGETSFPGETATGFEHVFTGNGHDRITGSAAGNVIQTGGGNDSLAGVGGNDNLFAGAGGDTVTGGVGDDLLNGSLGTDRITGGPGIDTFVFNSALNQFNSGFDRILDFNHDDDSMFLDDAVFTNLALGPLVQAAFHVGIAATAASHRIIYNDANGSLFFDPDGAGGTAKTKFAQVDAQTFVTHEDFTVF
jgi:Ca2+-binding RTX toxin-like protein